MVHTTNMAFFIALIGTNNWFTFIDKEKMTFIHKKKGKKMWMLNVEEGSKNFLIQTVVGRDSWLL
jgi:hypothetical protein